MKSKIYIISFSSMWLGGKAVVKAINETAAHKALSKHHKNLDVIEKCNIKEVQDRDGVLYYYNGDY